MVHLKFNREGLRTNVYLDELLFHPNICYDRELRVFTIYNTFYNTSYARAKGEHFAALMPRKALCFARAG